MSNTYTQLYTQIVFAVKGRQNLISEKNREELEKYICGIINKRKSKALAIYCNPDHLHVLVSFNPTIAISDLTRDIKAGSSGFINDENWIRGKFQWQDGYGAFTYAKTQIDRVAKYILNQHEHHKKSSFKEEYLALLKEYEIAYDDQYLFDWYENLETLPERH